MKRFLFPVCAALMSAGCVAEIAPADDVTLLDASGPFDRAGLSVYLAGDVHSKTLAFDCLTTCDVTLDISTRFEGTVDPGPLKVDVRGPSLERSPREISGTESLTFARLAPGRYTVGLRRAASSDVPLSAEIDAHVTESIDVFAGGHARLLLAAGANSEDHTHLTFVCEEEGGCDAAFYLRLYTLADARPIPLGPVSARFAVRLSDELEDFGELAFERMGGSDVYVARRRVDPWARMHLDAQTGDRRITARLGAEWSPIDAPPDAVLGVTEVLNALRTDCTTGGRSAELDAEAARALDGDDVRGAERVESDLPIAAELVREIVSRQPILDRVARCEAFGVAASNDPRWYKLVVVTRPE